MFNSYHLISLLLSSNFFTTSTSFLILSSVFLLVCFFKIFLSYIFIPSINQISAMFYSWQNPTFLPLFLNLNRYLFLTYHGTQSFRLYKWQHSFAPGLTTTLPSSQHKLLYRLLFIIIMLNRSPISTELLVNKIFLRVNDKCQWIWESNAFWPGSSRCSKTEEFYLILNLHIWTYVWHFMEFWLNRVIEQWTEIKI